MSEEMSLPRALVLLAVAFVLINVVVLTAWLVGIGVEELTGSQGLAVLGGIAGCGVIVWAILR